MKVLIPVLHYHPVIGGLETWTRNIAEGIALRRGSGQAETALRRGSGQAETALRHGSGQAEIFVVTGRVSGQPDEEIKNGVKIFRTAPFPLKNLSYSSPFYILTTLPFIFLKSFSLIKKEKINLLHCQGFLSSFLGLVLSKLTGLPYVVTVQRLESLGFWRKLAYRRAEVCIGASRAIAEYFRKIGCKNIEVIPNGIDLEKFEGLEKKPHDGFIVITVARLEKVKGVEFLIRAFARSDLPRRSDLLIIGDGPERKNLESLTKELGLETNVEFLGEIPNERIPEYLARADCFVLPSLKEGFGIAVLEAMAAGVPVVASKVGGILDIVEDGRTGLLAEPGNPQEIAQAIQRIYQDPSLKTQLVNNAIAELKRYDWQIIAQEVRRVYSTVLK